MNSASFIAETIARLPALGDADELDPSWLKISRRLHLIGIGGAGMSAIATVLIAMGHVVSGSDVKDSLTLSRLRALGVECYLGHSRENICGADAVIYSSAIRPDNVELRFASEIKLPTWRRSQVLAAIVDAKVSLIVAGTHGKTSTSSMLALMLRASGLDPAFLIGGDLNEVGTNAYWGDGEFVVAEGDESDGTFLLLNPAGAVITGVEADHLENWGSSLEAIKAGFRQFAEQVEKWLVVNGDDSELSNALEKSDALRLTYGSSPRCDFQLRVKEVSTAGTDVEILREGHQWLQVKIPVPGRHFALNATGAAALASLVGARDEAIATALSEFAGVERRFQFRGEGAGVRVYDDYGHLPSEVSATLMTAREISGHRVIAIFQPHLYSRTASFAREFASALSVADVAIVTDVFGAREAPVPGVTGELIAHRVEAGVECHYIARKADIVGVVTGLVSSGDVVVVMGAGDITTIASEIVLNLRKNELGGV